MQPGLRRGVCEDRLPGGRALHDRSRQPRGRRRAATRRYRPGIERPYLRYTPSNGRAERARLWETGLVVNWRVLRKLLLVTVVGIVAVAGCHRQQSGAGDSATTTSYKVYKLRGKVIANQQATGEITVKHEAI